MIVTSSDLDDHSLGVPFALADPELIAWKETRIVVLSAAKDKVCVSFAIDVTECDLHVILGLALLDFTVCLGLLCQ